MKKSLHQLLSKNPQLRVLAFHGKEAPFTLKKRNQEKLLAYKGVRMSPPPLGISQSLKNSLISLKDENLAPCSTLRSLKFTLFRPLSSEQFSWLRLNSVQIRLKKGFLISMSHLASFSRLVQVSEFELSANLALSLENNRRLV